MTYWGVLKPKKTAKDILLKMLDDPDVQSKIQDIVKPKAAAKKKKAVKAKKK